MCILCDADSLRLLVAPRRSLSDRDLAEAIRVAREAAWQLVLDEADALPEEVSSRAALAGLGPDGYLEYVVERAERDGVAGPAELREWRAGARDHSILTDPRVQAFLSSAVEGLATYLLQIAEHRAALERYLEVAPEALVFAGIGAHGEIAFDYGEERYVALTDEEALRIAMDRISLELYREDPARLLLYTNLPDGAQDVLAAVQQREPDEANDILAGIVDLQALAEDATRQGGFARYVTEGLPPEYAEQRFGDRVIIRMRIPDGEDGAEEGEGES